MSDLPIHAYDSARMCCAYDADAPIHDTSALCGKWVTYEHLAEPRWCPKRKGHRGACWGGGEVLKVVTP